MVKLKVKDHIPVELRTLNIGDLFIHKGVLKNIGAVDSNILMVVDNKPMVSDEDTENNDIRCVCMNGEDVGELIFSDCKCETYRLTIIEDMVVELE